MSVLPSHLGRYAGGSGTPVTTPTPATPTPATPTPATLAVAPVSYRTARHAVDRWHYSHTMPQGRAQHYGVWEHGRFVGVVLYGRGANRNLGPSLGLSTYETCELTRIALGDHDSPVSQIVPRTIAILRASSPGLRVIVSLADPYYGHHGGIYQAMNWLYLGTSQPTPMFRDAHGRLWHHRVVGGRGVPLQFGRQTAVPRRAELEALSFPGKHRYAWPLDRATRRRLTPLCEPYPAAEVSEVTRLAPGEEGQVRSLGAAL